MSEELPADLDFAVAMESNSETLRKLLDAATELSPGARRTRLVAILFAKLGAWARMLDTLAAADDGWFQECDLVFGTIAG